MRKFLGVFAAACFYYSGLTNLAGWRQQRRGKQLVILNYHRATGGNMRRHLLYLRRHYRMLHLEEALEELYAEPSSRPVVRDRRMPLVLTFDDGYHDNYTHAFALARELHVPITIFLIPGYIESGEPFWWLEGRRLAKYTQAIEVTIEGRVYQLEREGEREALSRAIDERLRYAGSVAEREAFLHEVRHLLAVTHEPSVEEVAARPLTWSKVQQMQESGWVSFGAHTMHHPLLAALRDPREVQREVQECRTMLERRLGRPVRVFAFPVGKPEHYGEHGLAAVKLASYSYALTTLQGINTPQSDPHQLRRVAGDVSRHWLVMAAETSGVWHFFSPLWKKKDRVARQEWAGFPEMPVAPALVLSKAEEQ